MNALPFYEKSQDVLNGGECPKCTEKARPIGHIDFLAIGGQVFH